MPGYIVHLGAVVICAHAGQATPTVTNPRVKVSSQPTVFQSSIYSVAGCTMPPPIAGNGPCVTGQWLTASLRVKSLGQPLVIQSSTSLCAPTGTPLSIVTTQVRVKAT